MAIGRAAALLALILATPGGATAQDPVGDDGAVDARFDIGGRSLHLRCTGPSISPHPTLVMESDLGLDVTAWDAVTAALPADVRACAWDRPGTGGSQPAPIGRPMDALAGDLRDLLAAAGVPGPYLLVADRLGGWFAAAFAVAEPDLVAGLVWSEPVSPTRDAALRSVLGTPAEGEEPAITAMRELLDAALPPPAATLGHLDIAAVGELATPLALGDRPLVLLDPAAALDRLRLSPIRPARGDEPPDAPWRVAWERIDAWAPTRSSAVHRRVVPGPTGIVGRDPDAVVDAIADVTARLRADRRAGTGIARLHAASRVGGRRVPITVEDRTGSLARVRPPTSAEASALALAGPDDVVVRVLGRDRDRVGVAWRGSSVGCEPSATISLTWPARVVVDVATSGRCGLRPGQIVRPVVLVRDVVLQLRRSLSPLPPTVAVYRTGPSWTDAQPARLTATLPGGAVDIEVEVDPALAGWSPWSRFGGGMPPRPGSVIPKGSRRHVMATDCCCAGRPCPVSPGPG